MYDNSANNFLAKLDPNDIIDVKYQLVNERGVEYDKYNDTTETSELTSYCLVVYRKNTDDVEKQLSQGVKQE